MRILAIVKSDFLIRFRRASTVVLFLILCIAAYWWIPDPSTGKALVQVKEQRALYNSAAIALGTSSLYAILMGLFGYYMVSNSIRRDVQTRAGLILASTTMKNWEYLTGKFLGNLVFLSAITLGFMISAMVMQMVRGEAPLEPSYFFAYYLVIVPPLLIFLSAIAIVFESIRFLSGKFGDLVYFFVWLSLIAFTAISTEKQGYPNTGAYFDFTGMGFLLEQVRSITGADEVSIGSSEYNKALPPFVFDSFPFRKEWIVPRIVSMLAPVPLLLIALLFFHRFNPDRLKASARKTRQSIVMRMNTLLKPVSQRITSLFLKLSSPSKQGKSSFVRSVAAEALLTLQLYPAAVVMLLVFVPLTLIVSVPKLRTDILPVIFAGMALVLADISTREKTTGTLSSIYATPYLRTSFVWWKIAAAILISLLLTGTAIIKLAFADPFTALALLSGTIFTAICAVALGILSSNPKTFIVMFLMFLYLVMNDRGQTPGFDFSGWYGSATPVVLGGYAAAGLTAAIAAALFHHWRLVRS